MALELGSGYLSLNPAIDRRKLRSETRHLEDELDRAGADGGRRAGDGFAGAFGGGIKRAVAAVAVAFAGLQLGSFLKDAVGAASDLGETTLKVTQIFGSDALPALEEFAAAAAKSLGQSKQSALDAAATFGVFGKSAGLTGRDLAGFSTEMVQLASDLASFGNTSPEEAIEAIGAALRGESEPIRRYGVLLDDATLRNRALALGLIKTTKEALTPQQRVLAAQAEILAQTSDAQGDFARTSDGLANQQRILRAELENSKAVLGEALLPAATAVVTFLNTTGIPAFRDFAGAVKDAFTQIAASVTGAAGFGETVAVEIGKAFGWAEDDSRTQKMADVFRFIQDTGAAAFYALRDAAVLARDVIVAVFGFVTEHQDAFSVAAGGALGFAGALGAIAGAQQAIGAVSALGSGAGLLGKVLPVLATPVGLLAVAIAAVAVAAFVAYKKFEPFRNVVDTVARTVRDVAVAAFERLKELVKDVAPAFDTAKGAAVAVKDAVVGFARDARASVEPFVTWFQTHVTPTLAAGWDAFSAATTRVGEILGAFLVSAQTIFQALLTVAGPAFDALGSVFSTFISVVQPIWDRFWNAIQMVAATVFELVRVGVETVLGLIRGIFQQITGLIDGDWSKFWEGIKTIASAVVSAIEQLVKVGLDAVKRVFSAAFDTVKMTVSTALDEVVRLVGGLAGRAVSAAGDLLSTLVQKGRDLIQGLINGIGAMWGAFSGALGGIPGRIVNAVGDLSWVLYDAGWDLIQGLISGIRDAIPGVRGILGKVTDLIPDWKGPAAVDKRLLFRSGEWIMEGLAAGIASQLPPLQAQLSGVTATIEQTVVPAPTVRSVAAPDPAAATSTAAAFDPSGWRWVVQIDGRDSLRSTVRVERAGR